MFGLRYLQAHKDAEYQGFFCKQEAERCLSLLPQLLANSKLVAVCQLQHCKLTLVPYIEARSGQLRIMGFLIADDLGT